MTAKHDTITSAFFQHTQLNYRIPIY